MMLLKVLKNVFRFRLINHVVYYYAEKSTILQRYNISKFQENEMVLHSKIKDIFVFKDKILVTSDTNKGYWLDGGYFEEIENFKFDSVSENLELGVSKDIKSYYPVDIEHTVFSILEEKTLWKGSFSNLRFENDLLFSNLNHGFILFNPKTGDVRWQYDVPSEFDWVSELYINQPEYHKAEIQRLIGIYQGILWLTLNNGRLLGLDAESGNLVYNIHQVNQHGNNLQRPNLGPFWGNYLQLDAEKGVLFGLRNHYYYEIDLKAPDESYFLYDISESCKTWKIEADVAGYEWSWKRNEIYFGQNFSDGNNLGIFERSKHEIIWATRLQKDNGQARNFNKIEYADGKMYALDQSQTLHIFERESPASSTCKSDRDAHQRDSNHPSYYQNLRHSRQH